jgi:hypothetical protein
MIHIIADTVTAAPAAIPSIAQAQSALTGLQTAWNDLLAAWDAFKPVLTFIGTCAAFAAGLPHPSAGSILSLPRKLLDVAGANVLHAKNVESPKA